MLNPTTLSRKVDPADGVASDDTSAAVRATGALDVVTAGLVEVAGV